MTITYVFTGVGGGYGWNDELDTYDIHGNLIDQRFGWTVYSDINNPPSGVALEGLFPNDPLSTTNDDVRIGPAGGALAYQVTLTQSDHYGKHDAAKNLTIAAGSSLSLIGGEQGPGNSNIVTVLTINGDIHNNGRINIDTTAYHGSGIVLQAATRLDGGGVVDFDDVSFYSNAGFFNESGYNASLLNIDNQITGRGEISNITDVVFGPDLNSTGVLAFTNQGVVNANKAGALTIDAGSATVAVINSGVMESTGTGGLFINTPTLDNRGGRIFADVGATVTLSGTRLVGGLLIGNGTGQIVLTGASDVLDATQTNGALTNSATLALTASASVVARGGLANNGAIVFNTAAYAGTTALLLDGDYQLSGAGSVQFAATLYGSSAIANVAGQAVTFTNANTIHGAGSVGVNGGGGSLALVNNGALVADDATGALVVSANTVTNAGTISATGAAGLVLSGVTLTSTQSGVVQAQDGSHVDLASATVGGALASAGTGFIQVTAASTLDGASLAGTLRVADQTLKIRNGFQDNGVLRISAGSYSGASVQIDGSASFGGVGSVDFVSTGFYSGVSITNVAGADATLSNTGTLTLTGLYGAIASSSGVLTLRNSGVLTVAGGVTLTLGYASPTVVNTGTLGSSGSGALSVVSTSIKNQGGVISAAGNSHIDLSSNSIIFGGSLSTTGAGYIDTLDSTVTLSGGSFGAINSTAQIRITDGTSLAIAGPFVNNGHIVIGSATGGQLYAGAGFTGTGDILLTNAGAAITGGFTDTGDTILGQGTISASIDLEAGAIDANVAGGALALTCAQAITNNALLEADGGVLAVSAAVAGSGAVLVKNGGTLSFAAAFNQNAQFQGAGTLALAQSYAGAIQGFALGDIVDLTSIAYAAGEHMVLLSTVSGRETFALEDAGNTILGQLAFTGNYAASDFVIGHDGSGHAQLGYYPHTAKAGNFYGDTTSGVLWSNSSSGTVLDWRIAAGQVSASSIIAGFAPGSGWSLAGTGDFSGDGATDVLLNYTGGGQTTIGDWLVANGVYAGYRTIGGFSANSGWAAIGTGDFNNDGTADVLLSYTGSGVVLLYDWQVANGQYSATNNLNMGFGASSGWAVIGTGDFNGDGAADILFKNAQSGLVADWSVVNNTARAFTSVAGVAPGSGWNFDGVGDFNGDGTSDLLWQNQNSGTLAIWDMRNGALSQPVTVGRAAPTGYIFEGIGDFFGTGASDILWQRASDGQALIWDMSNGQVQATTTPGGADPSSWHIVK